LHVILFHEILLQ
jgi:hypothetical protein